MKDSRKALLVTFTILIMLILSVILMYIPFASSEHYYYCDTTFRNSLEGEIDFLVCGSSPAIRGYDTHILDEELNVFSYNIAGSLMTWAGREALLKEEINRQPLKTVIIELSYDSLTRSDSEIDSTEGFICVLPRINSTAKRVSFILNTVNTKNFDFYLSNILKDEFSYNIKKMLSIPISVIKGTSILESSVNHANKGYLPYGPEESNNMTTSVEKIGEQYNSTSININFDQNNINHLQSMIAMCKEKEIEVIITVVPNPLSFVWSQSNIDEFDKKMREIAESNGCSFYDFNLLKDRFILFSDTSDWWDSGHLSANGATTFTKEFSCIYSRLMLGEDISDLFFSNQDEMKQQSPLWTYLNL